MYELMAGCWPTADGNPELPDYMREYSVIWKSKPKVVFSSTLDRVDWNSRLATMTVAEEVATLKQRPDAVYSVGGATLAASVIELGLVDEYWLYVSPVILGGGKPMFPRLHDAIRLRLAATRTFRSGVVLLRYTKEAPG